MRISGILIREINERHFKIFARSIGNIRMRLIQIGDTVKKNCQFLSITINYLTPLPTLKWSTLKADKPIFSD